MPSLKMMTPLAPACWARSAFSPKVQPPRWITTMLPSVKRAKSPAWHPLVELTGPGSGLGGITTSTGWTAASAVPSPE